jgi:hypothetical protein
MASGGIYKFVCTGGRDCPPFELFVWDSDIGNVCCPVCARPCRRETGGSQQGFHTLYSDAMGVHPSQVAEHRRLNPHIPMTDDGRVIIKSARENERICKALGPGWEPTR